ncbi:MAG: hypothetical protein RBR78_09305 [Flavobacteriaceae bacterium]|jgi:hypothetical protein|nr:hypothetical protein [Flavobacteriaceae bacterium]
MNLKKIYIVLLIFLSGIVFGQDANINSQSIKANFSTKNIQAYQENSQNKLDEFYEYLSLYSTENNENLKSQIRENIFSMVENGIEIPDFTELNPVKINLPKFLSKIENQSILFKIKSDRNPTEAGFNQWTNPYVLSVSQNGKTTEFEVEQIIYFEPKEKQFGSKTKTVWEIKLGDIQQ